MEDTQCSPCIAVHHNREKERCDTWREPPELECSSTSARQGAVTRVLFGKIFPLPLPPQILHNATVHHGGLWRVEIVAV